jgi:hypothetical protein
VPQLNERLFNGRLEVYAGNQLAGGSVRANTPKELPVEYSYAYERHKRGSERGKIFSLP